ncbi:MAG: peptide-methionine (R)-S-oxide reductase MsrB [Phycisphaerales bacterium]|nr:peptide-methionine (R)-S-oxide reductase MsrB [Hyphomonadaceae bacterium]
MKLIAATIAATLLAGGAGYYAYAQTQPAPRAEAERSPSALERLRNWVMDQGGTERAFDNEYWNHHDAGIYVEARTGEALFASTTKYDSGSGWPSFTRPVNPDNIVLREEYTMGMRRIEVRSRNGNAHLGHVFDDGPRGSGGQRFCINSCAIRFIPRDQMEAQGYGRYLSIVDGE